MQLRARRAAVQRQRAQRRGHGQADGRDDRRAPGVVRGAAGAREQAAEQEGAAGADHAQRAEPRLLAQEAALGAVGAQRFVEQRRRRAGQDRVPEAEQRLAEHEARVARPHQQRGEADGEHQRPGDQHRLVAEAVGEHAGRHLGDEHRQVVRPDDLAGTGLRRCRAAGTRGTGTARTRTGT
ncbi:MAG: hypothetical protein QM775_25040 [Pirellulales bacterium]